MRAVKTICFVAFISCLLAAQSSPPIESDSAKIQKLMDAMAAQQKAIADQQQEISQQRQEIETLKRQLNGQSQTAATTEAQLGRAVDASLTVANTNPAMHTVSDMAQEKPKESPLSVRIGAADFTPGGFVDFENVFRSTNTGSIASTGFGGIPFSASNSPAGHLSEFHSTGQYSRLNLRVNSDFAGNKVTGYVETDFNGNDAANVLAGTNPHTFRLRLFFVDLKRTKWEFIGGQTWSLVTPNRTGLGTMPSDLAITLNEDANIQVGIQHTRQSTFRAIYSPNANFGLALAVENQQQFTNGEIVFPTAFGASTTASNLSGQFDAGGPAGTPNLAPDIAAKLGFDGNPGGRHIHLEAGGIMRSFKIANIPTGVTTFTKHSYVGGGLMGAFNVELVKGFRFLANGLYGPGVGRYLIQLAPDVVVLPAPGGTDVRISPVHSGMGLGGIEWQLAPKTVLGAYYGGMFAQRNFALDTTAGAPANTFSGFGSPKSPNSHNRSVQEATLDLQQTFWRNPQYGALLLIAQASYVTRSPWVVAVGAPKNAHLGMGYLSLRYVLP